jgi:thiosulfate dehydrogenase
MKKRFYLVFLLLMTFIFLLSACTHDDMGPHMGPHMDPDESEASQGGLLYDKWWVVSGAVDPETDHPLWALQDTNTRSGSDTWRCKECHGWDYKGKDGAYGEGSHYTGFPGVYDASQSKTKDQLLDALTGGTDDRHDFSQVLSEAAREDLADFLKEYIIDDAKYINYDTKEAIAANMVSGRALYSQTCRGCHGSDGKRINFGSGEEPEYVGTLARDNPWETLHKIRFGSPDTSMPSAIAGSWSIQNMIDVLGYTQTLPK